MNRYLEDSYPEIHAGGFSRLDGTIAFYQRINALLAPSMTVLDFGAGRGAFIDDRCEYRKRLRLTKERVQNLIGVDVDKAIYDNPVLNTALLCDSDGRIPLPDQIIDLLVSDWTFEHLEFPDRTARELDRVLKPGGWICARTINKCGYIALFNRMIHSKLHRRVLERLQPGRKSVDVFSTFYRLNTQSALHRYFPEDRYIHCSYTCDSEPRYFGNSRALLWAFELIQAITPPAFKTTLMIFLRKRELPQ